MVPLPRTDLACEATALWQKSAQTTTQLQGVVARDEELNGCKVTTVEILDEYGAKELCKPIGKYYTLELDKLLHRNENAFEDAAAALSILLKRLSLPAQGMLSVPVLVIRISRRMQSDPLPRRTL